MRAPAGNVCPSQRLSKCRSCLHRGQDCAFAAGTLIQRSIKMNNIFYVIGVVVVILFVLGYFGLHA
jgi:hypothetical protein